MTATVQTDRPSVPTVPDDAHLTFPRIVASEWIKFRTLRSTVWILGITLVVMIGFSLLLGLVAHNINDGSDPGDVLAPSALVALVNTFGYYFAELIVAVLGVLLITGEYGTGMIRSTMAAVPKRLPALAAKYLVVGVTTFVVAAIAIAISFLVTKPILARDNLDHGLDSEILRVFLGCATYLALIAMFALAVGALLRHSAAAISAVLGVLLLVPIILGILSNFVSWADDITKWLPTEVGARMMDTGTTTPGALTPWEGFGMLLLYTVVLAVASGVLLRRRDV